MHYIYLIVNKVNGKTYVGQHKSNNWQDRYMGSGHYLAYAKKKYGIENFEKFLIQYCNNQEEANKAEMFWISEYRKRGKAEYNLADGGDGRLGYKVSDETRRKIAKANTGKHPTPETLEKLRESHKGQRRFGYHHTEESKQKMSESHKGMTSPRKGAKVSDESKKKMSEAHKGQKAWCKGRKSGFFWYTNGAENCFAKECPEGFHKGRTRGNK